MYSFNGEPQAEAKSGNEACGLPLNDQINNSLAPYRSEKNVVAGSILLAWTAVLT